ncbi:AarF/UbiB family protein [Opitutus sp. ER46]|uniref:ABC1 kinase family protein n=1 Tax=Opitutus sp. ER46 TaxID=2161864 RepID=UPI000D321A0C|nr:AarF/UbiB family protein [Opitutus sp. ER46]PTY00329.1 ABC transporter [Opitutus sp. ER46]
MKLSAHHLKRYREIAALLWKYGRSDLVARLKVDDELTPDQPAANQNVSPEQLADDLEAMGPTYVKLGQVLAGRPDLIPEPYRKALARLQDNVKPFPYEDVERIVVAELGVRISKAFARFDPEPIAAASLGQVHFAHLRDGRPVVVKIQRPDIRPAIAHDFEVMEQIAAMLDAHTEAGRRYRFSSVVEEFRLTIQNELNYEREAQNLIAVRHNLEEFENIRVPEPILDYTTRNILTMEYVTGRKITSLTPLARLDVKGEPLCEDLFRAYLKQVLIDGLFHADPHPGNVFLTDDGRLALLDLGMVGHTTPQMQEHLLKLLFALSDGNSDTAAEIVTQISERADDFDAQAFRHQITKLVAQRRDQALQQMQIGRSLLEVSKNAAENGLHVPSELTLLGKTLIQLDEIGRILAPDFDPNGSVRRNLDELMVRRLKKDASKGNLMGSMLEMKGFVGALPGRLNRIFDVITNAELEVKVRSLDTKVVMEGMQKIANRITTGLVLAALIIGAAQLMRVETPFRLFGYPGIAILCFLGAAAGGFWLVISIFVQDYKTRKRLTPR